MPLVARQTLPRIVERGVAQTLTRSVSDTAGNAKTATAGTLTIRLGSTVLVDAADLSSSLGPPASYSLSAATTSGLTLDDGWLEEWALTIDGRIETFRVRGYLCRHRFYAAFDDNDLEARHYGLSDLLASGETFEDARVAAEEYIERRLLRRGRRPHLVFENHELIDAGIALTLHYKFKDWASRAGSDSRYHELAADYWKEFERELEDATFSYDADEDGVMDADSKESSAGPLVLTAGRPRSILGSM